MTKLSPKNYIAEISAYVPGKAGGDRPMVKMSANENPLGCSPLASEAAAKECENFARYPNPASHKLRSALAAQYGLEEDLIICGTGSDELLNLAAQGYAGQGDEIIHVRYGFAVYEIATRKVGAETVIAPDKDYGTDVDAILDLVTDKTRVVFLANPNNPTGTLTPDSEIERLHAALPKNCLFVLDQAYGEFLDDDGPHAFNLARDHDNVLITRTFSKIYGLAAERIGWAFGHADIIDTINRIRGPFNVTTIGQAAAIAALKDQEFVQQSRAHNAKWRDWMMAELEGLSNHGLTAIPSHGNFIMVIFDGMSAQAANEALMEAGYIVRWLPGQGLANGLRISIGTEDENRGLIGALRQALEAYSG